MDELEGKNSEFDEALKAAIAEKNAAVKDLEDFKKTTAIKEDRFLKNLEALEAELKDAKNGGASTMGQYKDENEQLTARVNELEATIKENEGKMATAKNLVDSLGEARKEITALTDQNKNLQAKLMLIAGGQPAGVTSSKGSSRDVVSSANHELQTSRSREKEDRDRHRRRESKSMKETSKRRDDGERRSHRHHDRERDRKPRRSVSKDDSNIETEKDGKSSSRKLRRAATTDDTNLKDRSSRREDRDRRDKERSGEHRERPAGDKDKERSSGDRDRREKDKDRHRDRERRDKDKDRHRDKDRKDRDRDREKRHSRMSEKPGKPSSSRRPSNASRRPSNASSVRP